MKKTTAKTRIIFLRHGDVENPQNVVYGRLPRFPLSKLGRRDIENVANELKSLGVDGIYTSPLLRTRQTAQIVGKKVNKKPIISSLAIEVDNKAIQGMDADVFASTIEPEYYTQKWYKKGIEAPMDIAERMSKLVKSISQKHPNKTIVVVSHGDPIIILKAYVEKKPFSYEYKIKHYVKKGRYFILEIDNKQNLRIV